jgi:hypothetical protein
MSPNSGIARLLRFLGILFMAATAAFTLLGGAGMVCVAFNPTGFSASMALLAPFQWLYVLFMLIGVALGVYGIWVTVLLVRGRSQAYKMAVSTLVAGVIIGGIHIAVSRLLRGASMPVDMVVMTTVATLALFLVLRIPAIWQGVNFHKGAGSNQAAGGAAAIVIGVLMLFTPSLVGATHTWNGINYANAFNVSMTGIGLACLLFGIGMMINLRHWKPMVKHQTFQA